MPWEHPQQVKKHSPHQNPIVELKQSITDLKLSPEELGADWMDKAEEKVSFQTGH